MRSSFCCLALVGVWCTQHLVFWANDYLALYCVVTELCSANARIDYTVLTHFCWYQIKSPPFKCVDQAFLTWIIFPVNIIISIAQATDDIPFHLSGFFPLLGLDQPTIFQWKYNITPYDGVNSRELVSTITWNSSFESKLIPYALNLCRSMPLQLANLLFWLILCVFFPIILYFGCQLLEKINQYYVIQMFLLAVGVFTFSCIRVLLFPFRVVTGD